MPAAYAHLRFGWERKLPGPYASLPKNFPQLYNLGLQGPDLFFFYNPLFHTATGKLGSSLHELSGKQFFENALASYRKAPFDGARAYLFGLLGHYCLDSRCHKFIYEVTAQGNPGHTELETEFDRALQQIDGKLPQDRNISQYFRLTKGERATIAAFYPETSPTAIGWCVGNMRRIYRLIASRRRKTARFLLSLGGKNGIGMVPTVGPNRNCAHLNDPLLKLYHEAEELYPTLAFQLIGALETGTPLGEEFASTFNR